MKSFNADFYATAATVIPVLYLALAVQGSAFGAMLRWLSGVHGWLIHRVIEGSRIRAVPFWVIKFASVAAVGGVMLTLVAGLVSEILDLRILLYRPPPSWQADLILWSLSSLAALIVVVTAWPVPSSLNAAILVPRRARQRLRDFHEFLFTPGVTSGIEAELAEMDPAERERFFSELDQASEVLEKVMQMQKDYNAARGYGTPAP